MALTVESYAEYMFRLKPREKRDVPEWTPPVRAPRPKHEGLDGSYLFCDCAHCVPLNKEADRNARLRWVYGDQRTKQTNPHKTPPPLVFVGAPGPATPIWARKNPVTVVHGKADPIWDTKFETKFSRKPAEDAPLVTPKGAQKLIDRFLSRVEEIAYLASTQHQELATTLQEMSANGMRGFSLDRAADEDAEAANIAQSHLRMVPVDPDPGYISTMSRRIEWERYMFACGPVHHTRFAITKDGALGIVYDGPEKDPDKIIEHKRFLKYRTLERMGRLPTVEEVADAQAFIDYYKNPFNAIATDAERQAYIDSRTGWETNEDPDPFRVGFHAVDLRGKDDRGYAGPHGALGLDDEDDDEFRSDEDSE